MSKQPFYSIIGIVTSSTLAGLLMTNLTQAQSIEPNHNQHHPNTQTPKPQSLMMARPAQHFIEMMIPHHQDAVEIANLALTRAEHPEIKKLATTITQDQTREIQQMRDWYKAWYGKDAPQVPMGQAMMAHAQGKRQQMNQSGMPQHGMMRTDLETLKNAANFDKEFLRQMIPHHQMAVHMAQMVLNQKTRPEIRTLAQSIIKTQTAEINEMEQWQQTWFK